MKALLRENHQGPDDLDLGHTFAVRTIGRGQLTTAHSASSYGIPVFIFRGQAFGPGDLPSNRYIEPIGADRYGLYARWVAACRAFGISEFGES